MMGPSVGNDSELFTPRRLTSIPDSVRCMKLLSVGPVSTGVTGVVQRAQGGVQITKQPDRYSRMGPRTGVKGRGGYRGYRRGTGGPGGNSWGSRLQACTPFLGVYARHPPSGARTVGGPGYRPVPLFLGSMPDTLPPGRPTPTRVEPSHGEVCRHRRNEAGGMDRLASQAGCMHEAQSGEPLQINGALR